MALSPAYLEWKRQTEIESEQRGLEQGLQQLQQERRMTLESLLQAHYGTLDAELVAVIEACLSLSADEYARELPVLLSLSREELVRRFGQSSET